MKQIINIPDRDMDVRDHLIKQDNISRYIVRLVRQDMNRDTLDDKIKRVVTEMLKNFDITGAKAEEIDTRVMKSISGVFDF